MKKLIALLAVCVATNLSVRAGELSQADQKWSAAVEKMILAGSTTISTPDENRAKLTKELAAKHGRSSKVEKTGSSYRIKVEATNVAAK